MSIKNTVTTTFRDIFTITFQKSPILLTGGIINKGINSALNSIEDEYKKIRKESFKNWNIGADSPIPVPLATLVADAIGAGVDYAAKGLDTLNGKKFSPNEGLDNLLFDFEVDNDKDTTEGTTLYSGHLSSDPQAHKTCGIADVFLKPSKISMTMTLAPHTMGYYPITLGVAHALSSIFKSHAEAGGRYIVLTPSIIWTHMILTDFSEAKKSSDNGSSTQFQLTFEKHVEKPKSTTEQKVSQVIKSLSNGSILPFHLPLPQLD